MDLSYDVEQTMLKDTLERFLRNEYSHEKRKQILASKDGWSPDVWRSLAEMGCLGLAFKEENDGLGGDAASLGIVAEAFGRYLVVEPFLATVLLAGRVVESLGTQAQKRRFLPALMAGESLLAFAHAESDRQLTPGAMRTMARRAGDGWTLRGRKTAVLGAPGADWLVTSAQVEGSSEIVVFTVAPDAPGVALSAWQTTHEQPAADIEFREVHLADELRLGATGSDATTVIAQILDGATALMCADAVGSMDALIQTTAEYLKTRVQFGQPLSRFQALQHRMAEMVACAHEARAITLLALLESQAAPRERSLAVSSAKAKVGRCAQFIGRNAVQLHGAIGATQDMLIGNYFRRLTAFAASLGSTGEHLQRYGELIGDQPLSDRALLRERA